MIINVNGISVDLIDSDDRQIIHLNAGHGYEGDSLEAWARIVKPGRTALDIGAYTGLYSIIAAKLGAAVVALEPMPANHWRASINIKSNKVDVGLHMAAASNTVGNALLRYNPRVPLTTGASLEAVAANTAVTSVNTIRIDDMSLRDVAAIKIDVERHEISVLEGAMTVIRRDRPSILIETLDDEMRDKIATMLPDYVVLAILDKRNTMFVPKRRST